MIKEIEFFEISTSRGTIISARCGFVEIASIIDTKRYNRRLEEIVYWYVRPTGILESAYNHDTGESFNFFNNIREFKTKEEAKEAVKNAFFQFVNLFIE